MANLSLRLLSLFMLAAFVLNFTNFMFVRVYNAARLDTSKEISAKEMRNNIDPNYWPTLIECDDKNTSRSNDSQSNNYSELDSTTHSAAGKKLENCPDLPPGLGSKLEDQLPMVTMLRLKSMLRNVKSGGIYQPASCKALQSAAIIIAYRGCKSFLNTFLNILHPFLIKQQLDYQIFVVEQSNKTQPYNRGKLLNVGFTEATRYRKNGFRCIILLETHIVPVDARNLYRCGWYPKQLAVFVEKPAKGPYLPLLGGAIAITSEQFLKYNGFSNVYWGNNADYYDFYNRIFASNNIVEKSFPLVGKYKTIRKSPTLWHKSEYLPTPSPLYLLDGLTSLTYNVDNIILRRLYTYLQVNIDVVGQTEKRAMYDKLLNPVTFTYKTSPQLKQ